MKGQICQKDGWVIIICGFVLYNFFCQPLLLIITRKQNDLNSDYFDRKYLNSEYFLFIEILDLKRMLKLIQSHVFGFYLFRNSDLGSWVTSANISSGCKFRAGLLLSDWSGFYCWFAIPWSFKRFIVTWQHFCKNPYILLFKKSVSDTETNKNIINI